MVLRPPPPLMKAICVHTVLGRLPFLNYRRNSQFITQDTGRRVAHKRPDSLILSHLLSWSCALSCALRIARHDFDCSKEICPVFSLPFQGLTELGGSFVGRGLYRWLAQVGLYHSRDSWGYHSILLDTRYIIIIPKLNYLASALYRSTAPIVRKKKNQRHQ